jgi:ketosteroid isomerase-like protein
MSRQNVDLHRRAIEAFNARDVEAVLALADSSVELHSAFATIGGGIYKGHDGLRTYFRDYEDAWGAAIRAQPEAYFDLGEHTLFFFVMRGRGQQSGAEVAMAVTQVARWREGLLVYLKSYMQREDALSDLGVSEADLEPIEP